MDALTFEFELMQRFNFNSNQMSCGYKGIKGETLLRIKDHQANYGYFHDDVENGFNKIISVNYTGEKCKNDTRTSRSEFQALYPELPIIEINFDFANLTLNEAEALIRKQL